MKTSDVLNKLEEYAPLEISRAFVAAGAYDNSGLLIDTGEPGKKAASPGDLSTGRFPLCGRSDDRSAR